MRKLTATLCLTIAVLIGSVGVSLSADKSGGDRALKELATLVVVRDLDWLRTFPTVGHIRRTSEKRYKPISSEKLQKGLFSGLKKAGFDPFDYDEISAACDAPDLSKFKDQFAVRGYLGRIRRAAYKAVQTCEIKYFMIVTLTLDGLSEREKGRILFEAEAGVYELSKPRNRTRSRRIAVAEFKGHFAGVRIWDVRHAVFEKVTAKLVGGKVAGSNKVYKGELLQKVRIRAKQRALAEAERASGGSVRR